MSYLIVLSFNGCETRGLGYIQKLVREMACFTGWDALSARSQGSGLSRDRTILIFNTAIDAFKDSVNKLSLPIEINKCIMNMAQSWEDCNTKSDTIEAALLERLVEEFLLLLKDAGDADAAKLEMAVKELSCVLDSINCDDHVYEAVHEVKAALENRSSPGKNLLIGQSIFGHHSGSGLLANRQVTHISSTSPRDVVSCMRRVGNQLMTAFKGQFNREGLFRLFTMSRCPSFRLDSERIRDLVHWLYENEGMRVLKERSSESTSGPHSVSGLLAERQVTPISSTSPRDAVSGMQQRVANQFVTVFKDKPMRECLFRLASTLSCCSSFLLDDQRIRALARDLYKNEVVGVLKEPCFDKRRRSQVRHNQPKLLEFRQETTSHTAAVPTLADVVLLVFCLTMYILTVKLCIDELRRDDTMCPK